MAWSVASFVKLLSTFEKAGGWEKQSDKNHSNLRKSIADCLNCKIGQSEKINIVKVQLSDLRGT